MTIHMLHPTYNCTDLQLQLA